MGCDKQPNCAERSIIIMCKVFVWFRTKLISLKFINSEKATNFREISTVDLSYLVKVKSTAEISQKFVDFSEYMNFKALNFLVCLRIT